MGRMGPTRIPRTASPRLTTACRTWDGWDRRGSPVRRHQGSLRHVVQGTRIHSRGDVLLTVRRRDEAQHGAPELRRLCWLSGSARLCRLGFAAPAVQLLWSMPHLLRELVHRASDVSICEIRYDR